MAETPIVQQDGVIMALGALPRSHDAAEDKYHFLRTTPPLRAVDLSQPRLLSRITASDGQAHDYRVPITDQGALGSCAAFAAVECAEMSAQLTGRQWVPVHGGWLYEQVRRKENTFPADSGSYPADNLDFAMGGLPKLSDYAYVQDAAFDYPASMDQDRTGQDWVLSHRPFYPGDGQVLENVWTALDQNLPIELGMSWLNEFFNPTRGILPAGLSGASAVGGHAITIWGIVPGYLLCCNHWTDRWSADAPQSGLPDMRPGDFAIPWEYATRASPLLWEYRAVSAEPVPPQPNPQPQPTTCRQAAVALAAPVVERYKALYEQNPRSTIAKYGLRGATDVQVALQTMPEVMA